MASIVTLDGVGDSRRGRPDDGRHDCRCVRNKRTGRRIELCRVPKSKKQPSGWKITGLCR